MVKININPKAGFTLLEVLVSMGIFILVWLVLVGCLFTGKIAEMHARHRVQAAYAEQKWIEYLRKQSFASIASSTASVTIDDNGTTGTSDDTIGTQTVTVTGYGSPTNYKKIVVQLTWNERLPFGRVMSITDRLGTYIANDSQVN